MPSIMHDTTTDFNLNTQTGYKDDNKILNIDSLQSLHSGIYTLENLRPSSILNAVNVQTSQTGINLIGGDNIVGEHGQLVTDSTYLRTQENTNKRQIRQLNQRFTLSTPYIKGFYDVDTETNLINTNSTLQKKSVNIFSRQNTKSSGNGLFGDVQEQYQFTPMISKLSETVQDPHFIIPEDSRGDWKQGGISTRQLLREYTYKKKCEDNNILKKYVDN